MTYEIVKNGSRLFMTVIDGIVTNAESPTHPCFRSLSIGEPWDQVRKKFEAEGFLIHEGA